MEDSLSEEFVLKAQIEKMSKFCTDEILLGCHDDLTIKCGFIGEVGVANKMTGNKIIISMKIQIITYMLVSILRV